MKHKTVYKDNESDIVINLVGKKCFLKKYIFNNVVKNNVKNFYGKFNYNDNNYILVNNDNIDLIGFYESILTIVVIDSFDIENIEILLKTIEITNNIIICAKDLINLKENIFKIPIIVMDTNGIQKLLYNIDKYNYEHSINIDKIRYDFELECSIRKIKEYLDNIINYKNNRWLSIRLLSDNSIINFIKEYLNYDIAIDNIFLDIINKERNKFDNVSNIFNSYFINKYGKFLECNT